MLNQYDEFNPPPRPGGGDHWSDIIALATAPNYYETLNALRYGYTPEQLAQLNREPGFQHGQSRGYGVFGQRGFGGGPVATSGSNASTSGGGGAGSISARPLTTIPRGAPTGIAGVPASGGPFITGGGAGAGAGMGLDTILKLGSIGASALPLFNRGGNGAGNVPQNAQLEMLLQQMMQQFRQSQPLRDAIQRLAFGLLPISARQGLPMPGTPQVPANTAIPR